MAESAQSLSQATSLTKSVTFMTPTNTATSFPSRFIETVQTMPQLASPSQFAERVTVMPSINAANGFSSGYAENVMILPPVNVATYETVAQANVATGFADRAQIESLGPLREQISNIARELTVVRQDINTLRLADSQYEMQGAELSRHVREMGAQLRVDMQAQSVQIQDLSMRREAGGSTSTDQRSMQALSELQAQVSKDMALLGDRVSKLTRVCDERFGNMPQVQQLLQENTKSVDRIGVFQTSLSSEVQSMKRDFSAQISQTQATFRQSFSSLGSEVDEKMKLVLSETLSNFNFKDQLSQVSIQLSKESSARIASLEELISSVAAQEKAAREEQTSNFKVTVKENLASLVSLRAEVTALVKSSTQEVYTNLRELIVQERGSRENALGVFGERLKDCENLTREQLAQASKDNSARFADVKELLSKLVAQEKAARDELVANAKADLRDNVARIRSELADQKLVAEEFQIKSRALVDEEKKMREKGEDGFGQTLDELDRRVKDAAAEFCSFRDKAATCVMLESLERKLINENARLFQDVDSKYDQVKVSITNVHAALEGLDHKLTNEMRRVTEEQDRAWEDAHTRHTELADLVSQNNVEQHAIKGEVQGIFIEQLHSLENRLREFVSSQISENDARITGVAGSLTNLERKLRAEAASATSEQFARHTELKEQMAKTSDETYREMVQLKDQLARIIVEIKAVDDDSKTFTNTGLQDLEARFRRELVEVSENAHGSAHEYLVRERQDREASMVSVNGMMEDFDRRAREQLVQIADMRQENSQGALNAMLALVERKLRDELVISQDDILGKMADVKEGFQRCLNDAGSARSELKELITKVSSEEKKAREDQRSALAMSLEQVEAKLRREVATVSERYQSSLRDNLAQESQVREKAQRSLAEQLTDVERKLMAEIAQIISRDSGNNELRDMVATACSKERAHMQLLLSKEQEYRTTQFENSSNLFLQERLLRENQQESLRVYLTNEKMARDAKDDTFMAKAVYEVETKRVWEQMSNHTHDVQIQQNIMPQPPRQAAVQRTLSPMPSNQRVPSPPSIRLQQMPKTTMRPVQSLQQTPIVQQLQSPQMSMMPLQSSFTMPSMQQFAMVDTNSSGWQSSLRVGDSRSFAGSAEAVQSQSGFLVRETVPLSPQNSTCPAPAVTSNWRHNEQAFAEAMPPTQAYRENSLVLESAFPLVEPSTPVTSMMGISSSPELCNVVENVQQTLVMDEVVCQTLVMEENVQQTLMM